MMETFDYKGFTFATSTEPDEYCGAPWENEDGHGPVSDWRPANYAGRIPTAPGERVLHRDGRSGRVYDVRGAMEIALRDGWGISDAEHADMARKLGREPTRREVAAAAVESDYWRLRRWCEGDWCYVVLRVALLDSDGEETDLVEYLVEYLGGIESDSGEYLDEAARELAGEIIAGLPGVPTCSHCGVDAIALWDRVAGAWGLDADSVERGQSYCYACGGETSLVWKGKNHESDN